MENYKKTLSKYKILESDRLRLRPFNSDDAYDVFEYARDEIVTKYLQWPPHENFKQTEKILKDSFIDKDSVYAIVLKSENKCIGCIELRLIEKHDKANFGYVLNRKYWNNGYMTEALDLILDLAFRNLKLNRVEATYYVGNDGSGRVMEKCGMIFEGRGRQEVKIKGRYYDVNHYAILRNDWESTNC
ncbi:MAG: GNAT family N-acetyltransferase [bacterium]